MSGTGEPVVAPVVESAPNEPVSALPVPVVEVDIPADGGFPPEPAPEAPKEPVAAADEPKPDEPKPIKKSPYQARIDTLTARNAETSRQLEDATRQAELYKAMAEGKTVDADGTPIPQAPVSFTPGSPEFKKAVATEAAQIAANEAAKARTDKLLKTGNTDYKDFTDRCNIVASLGAGDRADFMQIVTDPDVIGNGAKVIADLAENPDEAARILALPPLQMAAALVKFENESSKAPAPRAISSAPRPITPIDGVSKGSDEPKDTDDMPTYAAKFRKQQGERMKNGQPARFARH